MHATVLAVGDELIADKVETNSVEIARRLVERGVDVRERGVVGDDVALLERAVRAGLEARGIIALAGGLGPTADDLTREAVAAATGRALVEHQPSAERLERLARSCGRDRASKASLKQAQVPDGARVLVNGNGTAPGWLLDLENAVVLALPGPPAELRPMLDSALDAAIAARVARGDGVPRPLERAVLRFAGIGESDLAERLDGAAELAAPLGLAWLASPGELTLELRAPQAPLLSSAIGCIRERAGTWLISEDGRRAAELLVEVLGERYETLGTVESCTGGLIGAEITSVPGSSSVFRGALVTYSDEAKVVLAGVAPELIAEHGAVSEEVARAMALGGRQSLQCDWVVAVTGVAGPGGGSQAKPVGLVHVALAAPDGRAEAERHLFSGDREAVRRRTVHAALDLLRQTLP